MDAFLGFYAFPGKFWHSVGYKGQGTLQYTTTKSREDFLFLTWDVSLHIYMVVLTMQWGEKEDTGEKVSLQKESHKTGKRGWG